MSVNYGQIILLLQSAPARAFSLFRERGYIDMAVVSAPHAPRHRHVTTQRWHSVAEGFPGGSAGRESACSAGDLGSIPGLAFQYFGLENSRIREGCGGEGWRLTHV